MKPRVLFITLCLTIGCFAGKAQQTNNPVSFDFLGNPFTIQNDPFHELKYTSSLSAQSIREFYEKLNSSDYQPLINSLLGYRVQQKLDDWLFYQLIRKTAQQFSPKSENYFSYTIFKWFLLTKSGYDAMIRITDNKMLFYVQSDETIYNIPYVYKGDKQYICLNYHDYGNNINFEKEKFASVEVELENAEKAFTYKVNNLPDIRSGDYVEKDLGFNYYQQQYHFTIKLYPEIKALFRNYPTADYSNQFSIPLSKETYNSLIPQLKEVVSPMGLINGVDYLMRFTRYAFLYEKDTVIFGREKRLSPEETLLYDQSDCEDRAALFFYLVKEIYDLPMIVLSYPNHVTVAVKFDKPIGKPIIYNGSTYYVCEPTPQKKDLHIGKSLRNLSGTSLEVVYAYEPTKK
jgi:hypothetical protein